MRLKNGITWVYRGNSYHESVNMLGIVRFDGYDTLSLMNVSNMNIYDPAYNFQLINHSTYLKVVKNPKKYFVRQ